jgi:hypothetical protein
MTGASKILTVSYGTFSCTLEGFDDPFNTMKAIAEYFRDLAADDRYFGAEPPVPDAAMLHKIAEREISRRVEARVSDAGVILRASDTVMPSIPTEQVPAPAVQPVSPDLEDQIMARFANLRADTIATDAEMPQEAAKDDAVPNSDQAANSPEPEPLDEMSLIPHQAEDDYIEDEHADLNDTPAIDFATNIVPPSEIAAPAEVPRVPHPRTRVVRIRRITPTPQDIIATEISTGAHGADHPIAKRSLLSKQAEDALIAELNALESAGPAIVPNDDAVSQMIARANADMESDAAKRRRNEIAQLKAAVVAKNAERASDLKDLGARALNAYRQDLERAVESTPAQKSEHITPLVLVSAQRVHPNPAPKQTANVTNIFDDDEMDGLEEGENIFLEIETFDDFSDRLGANSLIEMMEAAAIYCAHVKGEPLFRRRQLVRLMASIHDPLPINRETSLKVFQELIDLGRISEVETGLFAVTDRSEMLQDALRMAM